MSYETLSCRGSAGGARNVSYDIHHHGDPGASRYSSPVVGRVGRERIVGAAWGALFTAILAVLIVVGSRTLQHFDAALVGYTFAVLFAPFALTIGRAPL